MSADTTVIFAVAMDRERVSSFGQASGFPQLGQMILLRLSPLSLPSISFVMCSSRSGRIDSRERILASRAVFSGGLVTHNCLHHWKETTWILTSDQLDFWRISPKICIVLLICPPSSGCRNLKPQLPWLGSLALGLLFLGNSGFVAS